MNKLTFVTSNEHKAAQLKQWLDYPLEYKALELDETQSLDLEDIVTAKAQKAFDILQTPVLVEDVSLTFDYFGKLPGPLIKWFVTSLSLEQICALIPTNSGRQAQAQIIYALHDGVGIHHFEGHIKGMITVNPKGSTDFGWNAIFIPDGASLTYGEMDDSELKRFSHRMSAIQKLKEYLQYR